MRIVVCDANKFATQTGIVRLWLADPPSRKATEGGKADGMLEEKKT